MNNSLGTKLSGIFRGQVISHLQCGRCKVWIPDVFPEEFLVESQSLKDLYGNNLKGAKLPDAEQASPLFGGAMSNNGSFSYPKIGSYVWCMFERGDSQLPIYFAGAIDISDLNNGNSFSSATLYSENGEKLKHLIRCGESSIIISEDGSITLQNDSLASVTIGKGNRVDIVADTITLNGKVLDLHAEDSISLASETNIDIDAANRLGSTDGSFVLTTNGSCTIHGKELNTNKWWGKPEIRFFRGF